MVGGTIADIWSTKEYVTSQDFTYYVRLFFFFFCRRGLPMSIFALIALGATGIGPIYSGWIEINPKLGWRWIQWIHMMQVIPYLLKIGD